MLVTGGKYAKEWWRAEFIDYDWSQSAYARVQLYCNKACKDSKDECEDNAIGRILLEHIEPLTNDIDEVNKTMTFGQFVLQMNDFMWC